MPWESGPTDVVKLLLRHPKIDVNNLANTLFVAAEMGHAEVASLLLEKGAGREPGNELCSRRGLT